MPDFGGIINRSAKKQKIFRLFNGNFMNFSLIFLSNCNIIKVL